MLLGESERGRNDEGGEEEGRTASASLLLRLCVCAAREGGVVVW